MAANSKAAGAVKAVVFCGAKPGNKPVFGEKAAGKSFQLRTQVSQPLAFCLFSIPMSSRARSVSGGARRGGRVRRQSLWLHGSPGRRRGAGRRHTHRHRSQVLYWQVPIQHPLLV